MSDLSSARRTSRRIGRRQPILCKPIRMAHTVERFNLKTRKQKRVIRKYKSKNWWLEWRLKKSMARAQSQTEKANAAIGVHNGFKKTIAKTTEELAQLRKLNNLQHIRLENSVAKSELRSVQKKLDRFI